MYLQCAGVLVDDGAPQSLQEPVDTDDVVGSPGPVGVQWPHGHLVQAQGVGAVGGVDVIRADGVLQAQRGVSGSSPSRSRGSSLARAAPSARQLPPGLPSCAGPGRSRWV